MELSSTQSAIQRATQLFVSGYNQPSLDIIDIELNKNPLQGELLLLKATILHSQAKWKQAIETIETCSLIMPLPYSSHLVLADCYSYTDKHDLALTTYRYLLSQEKLPIDYYAGLYAGFKRAGNLELALATCKKAIELAPDNHEAYFGIAHCMSGLAYPPRQITDILRKAVKLAPENAAYRISLSIQLLLTKRRKEAYRILSEADSIMLDTVKCSCIARQLLTLCAWAKDEERCSQLGRVLARIG